MRMGRGDRGRQDRADDWRAHGTSGARWRHLLVLVALSLAAGCTPTAVPSGGAPDAAADGAAPDPAGTSAAAATPSPTMGGTADEDADRAAAEGFPLRITREIDGDSFVASDGVEYRVGLVNTAERDECGAAESSRRTYELLAGGFRAESYSDDRHGRTVARIATPEGDLGVLLAQEGLADDRYLEEFRHEHPTYAAELDVAFAEAREAGAGLHATCWADDDGGGRAGAGAAGPALPLGAQASPPPHTGRTGTWACHPAYAECLPDGPDLDCADVGHQVVLRGREDPYRLDGNSTTATDGVGCDSYPPWSAGERYPYYGAG